MVHAWLRALKRPIGVLLRDKEFPPSSGLLSVTLKLIKLKLFSGETFCVGIFYGTFYYICPDKFCDISVGFLYISVKIIIIYSVWCCNTVEYTNKRISSTNWGGIYYHILQWGMYQDPLISTFHNFSPPNFHFPQFFTP